MKPDHLIIQWDNYKFIARKCEDKQYEVYFFRGEVSLDLTNINTNFMVDVLNTAQERLNRYGRKVEHE